jgi:hypothetical protein
MSRYTVWACFGVDAESPRQAKSIINEGMNANVLDSSQMWGLLELWEGHQVNTAVFISPKLDEMLGEVCDDRTNS